MSSVGENNGSAQVGSGSQVAELAARACTPAPALAYTSQAAAVPDDSSLPAALVEADSAPPVAASRDGSSCSRADSALWVPLVRAGSCCNRAGLESLACRFESSPDSPVVADLCSVLKGRARRPALTATDEAALLYCLRWSLACSCFAPGAEIRHLPDRG